MSLGAGFSGSGFAPAGLGDIDIAPVPTTNLLIDANNFRQQNSRRIDPLTRQYVLDKTGAVSGMSGTQQMVQLRLQTVRGSSALANFGKASTPTVVSANTLRQMRADITVALNDMVISKMIVVNSISLSQVQPWQINGFVLWTDLTTGVESRNDL